LKKKIENINFFSSSQPANNQQSPGEKLIVGENSRLEKSLAGRQVAVVAVCWLRAVISHQPRPFVGDENKRSRLSVNFPNKFRPTAELPTCSASRPALRPFPRPLTPEATRNGGEEAIRDGPAALI